MSITFTEVDSLVKDLIEAERKYETAHKISSELHAKREEAYEKVIEALKAAGREKYSVAGVADISMYEKLKVQTPKTVEDKKLIFDYLAQKYGEDWIGFASINYNTLNSLYNEAFESAEDKSLFSMPGVQAPVAESVLRIKRY